MKWISMRKAIFGLSLTNILDTFIYSSHTTHIQQPIKSVKGNLLCAWNLFLRSFVFLCIFFIFSKKIKKKTIICDLFDRYGQWKTASNRRLIAMNSVFSFHWFWAFDAVHVFFFHPGRMADLPFLHYIRNMNDLGVNSIFRHFTKDPISASTTDFDFFAIFLLFCHFTLRSLNCHAKISENLSLLKSENIIHAKTIAVCCVWLPGTNFVRFRHTKQSQCNWK